MASVNSIPRELNWVEARVKCSISDVFGRSVAGAQDDVNAFNSTHRLGPDSEFKAGLNDSGNVFVVCVNHYSMNRPAVKFMLGPSTIEIEGRYAGRMDRLSKVVATLSLNKEGRCVLKSEDEELELWQLRRMMLEPLFFD